MTYVLGLNGEEELKSEVTDTFAGVGMIRGENLCISKMTYFTRDDFCQYVTYYLNMIANIFPNHEVWYRTADLVPHQVDLLEGCDLSLDSSNYLIGIKSVRRNLYNDITKETYIKELIAFINAHSNNKNLGLLIPYVTCPHEYMSVKNIVSGLGYDGKIGMMLEVPSAIIRIEEFEEVGVDNYTLGLNDLTSCILGASRDISIYSMTDKAVLKMIEYTLAKVHSLGKKLTVAGYLNKEIIQILKEMQVDKINVHYNDIPKMFDVENPGEYERQYKEIKRRYKEVKNGRD